MNMLFAATLIAAVDPIQMIVPILFFLVWIIGAIAKGLGQGVQNNNQQAGADAGQPARVRQQATPEELEAFLRQYGGTSTPVAQPEKRKPKPLPVAKPIGPDPRQTVAQRHLHSNLEDRRRPAVQSRLDTQTRSPADVVIREPDSTTSVAQAVIRRRQPINPAMAAMLTPRYIGRAFVLGQVLQSPPGLRDADHHDPLGPPVGTSR